MLHATNISRYVTRDVATIAGHDVFSLRDQLYGARS